MKKANTIITLLAFASFSIAATVSNGMNFNNQNMNLSLNTSEDVYGIQFDMHYNPAHINVEELSNSSSLISGVDIYSKVKEPGFVRVIMFSMDLNKISSANQLSEIIDFDITPSEGYIQNATITFDNIILAGENGQELDYQDSFVYEISSSDLIPSTTELSNVYPNPFNPSTNFYFELANNTDVTLAIYDIQGRTIDLLLDNEYMYAGLHSTFWNADGYPSGIYFVKLIIDQKIDMKKIMLLK